MGTASSSTIPELKIYPNPVTNIFSINTNEKIISIEVFNALGQKILSLKNEKTHNTERLEKGVYFVKVKTDKNEYVEKIIKQ